MSLTDQLFFVLGTGVVSGIVTSIIVWVTGVIWFKKAVPWYENILYRGISLKGHWERSADGPDQETIWTQIETMDLDQNAATITGTATLTPDTQCVDKQKQISLLVSGEISDRFVTLNFRSPTRDRLSYSSLLMTVSGDGNELDGHACWYNVDDGRIKSGSVKYQR